MNKEPKKSKNVSMRKDKNDSKKKYVILNKGTSTSNNKLNPLKSKSKSIKKNINKSKNLDIKINSCLSSLDKKKKINTKKSKEKKENQINLHLNKDNKRMNIKNININTNKIINARYNTNSFSKGKLNDAKKHKNNKIINIIHGRSIRPIFR